MKAKNLVKNKNRFNKNKTWLVGLALVLCSASVVLTSCSKKANGKQPNILFVLVDDLAINDVSPYGSKWKTPNIDRLRKEGMLFKNAYASSPVCSPTRASLMTGKHPSRLGITDWIPGSPPAKGRPIAYKRTKTFLPLKEVILGEALKKGGYQTAHLGKWHLGDGKHNPKNQGFEVNIGGGEWGHPHKGFFSPYGMVGYGLTDADPSKKGGLIAEGATDKQYTETRKATEYLPYRLTDEAIGLMQQFSKKKTPFYINLAYYTVHDPFEAYKSEVEKFKNRKDIKNPVFAAMVSHMDACIGKLLDALDSLGIAENTMVVFYSDNGGEFRAYDYTTYPVGSQAEVSKRFNEPYLRSAPYRGSKRDVYEGGIRVPLIVRYPAVIPKNSDSDALVNSMDFYPTLLDTASLKKKPRQHKDGLSFYEVLTGAKSYFYEGERVLLWDFPHYSRTGLTPASGALRVGDYKIIEFYETKTTALYNLKDDVGESENLADVMPDKLKAMRAKFYKLRKSLGARPLEYRN